MASFSIKKGLDIKLTGAPEPVVADAAATDVVTVYPKDFHGIKPRLDVAEGARVKRGTALFHDKRNEALRFASPAGGTVTSIVYGARRALEQIVIKVDAQEEIERQPAHSAAELLQLSREQVLAPLLATGYLTLIRQRPFGRAADPAAKPKSIFVNAMSTAPFLPDANVALKGQEAAFQAGLNALGRLTAGRVHLCLDGARENGAALTGAQNVQVHTFRGPHPAGNTSVHISRIDPIRPHETVWTVRAADVALIGHLLLTGEVSPTRIVSLGGPAVLEGQRKHFRIRLGAPLATILKDRLASGETRLLSGDALSGEIVKADAGLHFFDHGFTALAEDRERHLLGWLAPGFTVYSASKTFLSTWLGSHRRAWSLGTNQHGELRPMVLTGLYDRYMPLDIMTDFFVRAILAHDTDEAVKLGALEVLPEDFALCAFACPSKMDLVGIVRMGLEEIEKEGI